MNDLRLLTKQNHLNLLITKESTSLESDFNIFQDFTLFLIEYAFVLTDSIQDTNSSKPQFLPPGKLFSQNHNGARYLDPKYSRWISVDPALGEYVPAAGKSNEADKLPGMGGIFNSVNLSLYHYAGNNPLRYIDPTGQYQITAEDGQAYIIIEKDDNLWNVVKGQSPYLSDKEIINRIKDIESLNDLDNSNLIHTGDKLKAPDSVVPDITVDLFTKMLSNSNDPKISNPFYFKDKVKAGGEWDFKNNKDTIYCSNPLQYYNYIFLGKIIRYDAPGNIHYGFVGKAAWWSSDWLLFKGAGVAQIQDNPDGDWSSDDKYDAACIQLGIELYKNMRKK